MGDFGTIGAVIPSYNRGYIVGQAIDSALAQTHALTEIVVVDDGSSDDTEAVVARYGGRVKYVWQKNGGLAAARNTGVRNCTTDWVAFLDSDDYWRPEKTARQVEEIRRKPGAVLAYTGRVTEWSDGRVYENTAFPADQAWPRLRIQNFLPASSVMARRDVLMELGGFNESFRVVEDWDMWFRMYPKGPFASVTEPLTVITETAGSLSGNVDKMVQGVTQLADTTLLRDLSGLQRSFWRRRIISGELFRSFITMRDRQLPGANRYLWDSIRLWPGPGFLPKRYAALLLTLVRRPDAGAAR